MLLCVFQFLAIHIQCDNVILIEVVNTVCAFKEVSINKLSRDFLRVEGMDIFITIRSVTELQLARFQSAALLELICSLRCFRRTSYISRESGTREYQERIEKRGIPKEIKEMAVQCLCCFRPRCVYYLIEKYKNSFGVRFLQHEKCSAGYNGSRKCENSFRRILLTVYLW